MLERAGYEVMEALSGKEGLDLYRQTPVDLVLLDLHMPEMDGLEVTTILRGEYPDARIITMTALGQRHDFDFSRAAKQSNGCRPDAGETIFYGRDAKGRREVADERMIGANIDTVTDE